MQKRKLLELNLRTLKNREQKNVELMLENFLWVCNLKFRVTTVIPKLLFYYLSYFRIVHNL